MNALIHHKTPYTPSTIMRAMIRDNNMLLPAISRFNIAFGFGDATVAEVCRLNGVDTDTFLCVCNLLSGYVYDSSRISLDSLMGYLKRAHTAFPYLLRVHCKLLEKAGCVVLWDTCSLIF